MTLIVRDATPADVEPIRCVHRAAFGRDDEALLVERLVDGGHAVVSLVAIDDGTVTGHVLFSALSVRSDDGRDLRIVSLAPLAVLPARQRHGIGTALTSAGLERCRAGAVAVAVVLGHPEYYPRFGFSALLAQRLAAPFSGSAWMALELEPGALNGVTARVRFPAPFGIGA